MARVKMRSYVIAETDGSSLVAEGGPIWLFKPKERKELWRAAMVAAVRWFITNRMPARFSREMYGPPWNYPSGRGAPIPLVDSGLLRKVALGGQTYKITATGNTSTARYSVPGLPYINFRGNEIRKVLSTISQPEAAQMTQAFVQQMAGMIDGATKTKRGKLRLAGGA